MQIEWEGGRSINMPYRETEQPDDFTKPSRQNRNGKKQKNRNNEVRAPKEPYRRQRFSRSDVESTFDEDDDDTLFTRNPNSFPPSSRSDPNGED